jgi:hypothetical protein
MTVYFLQAGCEGGPIKIGTTNNLRRRMGALHKPAPGRLWLLSAISGGALQEGELHRRFSKHRISGEWFLPAPELLEYIASLPSPHAAGISGPMRNVRLMLAELKAGAQKAALARKYGISPASVTNYAKRAKLRRKAR